VCADWFGLEGWLALRLVGAAVGIGVALLFSLR